ncbi:MAG: hypothetical protein C00003105_00234 [ANME-2 cluster archaeon HR1]|nr:MAG: hypothetical protein C00003105_00234 [ANME-2 cluster archaeon HR1]
MLTSVPVIPIAIPISAAFNAGASLTPSPVTATTCPCFCSALVILNLCSGETRAYTDTSSTTLYSSSSLMLDISLPISAFGELIPSWLAIAFAVFT